MRKQVFLHVALPLPLGLVYEGDAPASTREDAPVAQAATVAEPSTPVSQLAPNGDSREYSSGDDGDGGYGK